MESHEEYKFIFLSEDAKENFSKMSEKELDFACGILAESISKTQRKIMNEMREKCVKKDELRGSGETEESP